MKSVIIIIVCMLLFFGCEEDSGYILENAKIINLKTGEVSTYNLLIRENIIETISQEKIKGRKKINIEGKYIIPSLWDMHVHLHADKSKLRNYFNQGVLGLRDLGAFNTSEVDSLVKWKQELKENLTWDLPDIEYVGLINNDTSCYHGHHNIATYKDLIASYTYLKEIGSSYYKVHNCFPFELLPQLDSLATKHNFVFGGHIPEGIDPLQYVRKFDNINSIEHVSVLVRALVFHRENPLKMIDAVRILDGRYLDSLAYVMKEKNIAFTPNLLSEAAFIKSYPEEQKHLGEALLRRYNEYIKRFSDHGVTILAGTDNGLESDDEIILYQELELLSQAGLSHLQVLQTATVNADKALGKPLNLIVEKSETNFIILDNNPLEDLTTLNSIFGIVHNGNYKALNKEH